MIRLGTCAALLGVLLAGTLPAAATKTDRYRGADELAARVDRLMDDAWKKGNVTPARPADDAEWLRRVYLDLAGRIPSVTEARTFLAERRSDKRQRLVESLLAEPRYPTWFASVWRALLLPEVDTNLQLRIQGPGFERWLREWLASERGYDAMVRELLTAANEPARGRLIGGSPLGVFYVAKENKPEEVAATASRLFLGINLGCAQCHNHPFAAWKKDQFWSFAAFFSDLQPRRQDDGRVRGRQRPGRGELVIPGTEKVVKARYLDGKQPDFTAGSSVRQVLADWMTATDNPYFARAAVNRLWAHFFGQGLAEPLDEMAGTESVPSQPAVLDELARGFAQKKYDLRWLIRAVTATRAYGLSSARSHPSQDDPRQFARLAVRGLSGEQLFDSLAQATGYRDQAAAGRRAFFGTGNARIEFLTKFAATSDRTTEAQTSILQALTLMNGRVMTAVTNVQRSETLQAVVDAPFMDVPAKIETLYLATLSRKPTAKEATRLKGYVDRANRPDEALADVFWALLNSAEFVLNH
jgi:hypothetical protein